MAAVAQGIGARVKAAREALGYTQQQLADKLGLDRLAVLRIEKGTRDPKTLELQAIADVLGVSLQSLIIGGGEEEHWQLAFRTSGAVDQADRELIAWARKVFLNFRSLQDQAKDLGIR